MVLDKVIPIPLYEQYPIVGDIIMNVGLLVRGRLDPERLKNGLTTLIVDHWPKLGARVKRNAEGLMELHVPGAFFPERPPFTFSLKRVDGPLPDDSLPTRTAKPSTHPGYENFLHLFRAPESAPTIHEFLELPDRPVVSLHVTTFTDVTLIGFTVPHCFTDMLGVGIILKAWCTVLAGHTPPPLFEEDDVLGPFGAVYPQTKEGVNVLREKKLTVMQLPSSDEETTASVEKKEEDERMLFVPSKVIDKHRAEALRELKAKGLGDIWFGEHDVLTAMLMKLSLSQWHSSTPDNSPHVMGFAFNLRGSISLLPASSPVYLHNGATFFNVPPIPLGELRVMSVGDIALKIRQAIVTQQMPEELERQMCIMKEWARLRRHPYFYESTQSGSMVSSWVSKEWAGLDFSGALAFDAARDSVLPAGKVVWHGASACLPEAPKRLWALVLSRLPEDEEFGEAGYWCEFAACRGRDFEHMQAAIAAWA